MRLSLFAFMARNLTRIVAFLLVPCLIADPVTTSAISHITLSEPRPLFSPITVAVYNDQALVAGLTNWTQSFDVPAHVRSIQQNPTYQRLRRRFIDAPRIEYSITLQDP